MPSKNQGEGNRDADRDYREHTRQFIREGQVDEAAQRAREALEGEEGAALREAEGAGKARSAGEDPELYRRAEPAWWTQEHANAWERVKAALYRDWLQTKADLHLPGGVELDQRAGDTVRQAAGKQSLSSTEAWDQVEVALRYGYGAAAHYGAEGELDEELMRADWEGMPVASEWTWDRAKQTVKRGAEERRKREQARAGERAPEQQSPRDRDRGRGPGRG